MHLKITRRVTRINEGLLLRLYESRNHILGVKLAQGGTGGHGGLPGGMGGRAGEGQGMGGGNGEGRTGRDVGDGNRRSSCREKF